MSVVPKPFPAEFRRDVIAVARSSDAPRAQIARDFGISESCLNRWMKIAERDDGPVTNTPTGAEAELRELRRRNKQLEQENEVLRRATAYFARDAFPK
jgi:transposase